jgi:hypothetical protein
MSKPSGWRSDLTFELRKSYSASRLGMTRVMAIHPFRQQPLSAALPAPGQRRPTALGSHPGAETVLAFPSSLRWLVGTFHKAEKYARRELRALTLKWGQGLSIYSGANGDPDSRVASPLDFCE